jgi:transposase-like protein
MNLSNPIYHNAEKAREHLEALLWPDGPCCPHCQTTNRASKIKGGRAGLYFCNVCRSQFSVTVKTVFERSKIPLNKWVLATHFMSASKTGVSAHQLHRMLDITYKSAWFMCHRIREAMKDTDTTPMGGRGESVQVDETYYGNTSKRATTEKVRNILFTTVDRKSTLVSDESRLYKFTGKAYADHQTVHHASGTYVNKKGFSTNNVENFFGVFKRSIKAHIVVSEQHLNRYVAESVFRYTNRKITDFERALEALKGIEGKRLTYRPIG